MGKPVVVIGYSGHAFVVIDALLSMNLEVIGYCEITEKEYNPYDLRFLGNESDQNIQEEFREANFFVGIGDSKIRSEIFTNLQKSRMGFTQNVIHTSSVVSPTAKLGDGVLVASNATINPMSRIGDGSICNTGCIIEHESILGKFTHVGPGSVLCGNVSVGDHSFIGANSVVKENIKIGRHAIIGAGTVVINDVPDHATVVGNPQRQLKQ